jgi:hypothetical protein
VEKEGHPKREAVLDPVVAVWGQRLRRLEHVCACVVVVDEQL